MRPFYASLPPPLLALLLTLLPITTHAADPEAPTLLIETTNHVTCSRPTRVGDLISVNYRGTLLATGALFDESYTRGEPLAFRLGEGQVIEGWDKGLRDMCPGEERKLTIPPEMAYGEEGFDPVIPPDSTLVFETVLVTVVGIKQDWVSTVTREMVATATKAEGGAFSIATAPSTPPQSDEDASKAEAEAENDVPHLVGEPLLPPSDVSTAAADEEQPAQCHLLGPFALIVQGALGAVALLTLVYKRWRETPKRPWKIFIFDVSKQVVGSCLTHVLNLAMSMLGSVDMVHAAENAANNVAPDQSGGTGSGSNGNGGGRTTPNPCSFYILNLGIDTTLGIPVLYLLLKLLHALFLFTPLARPKESIKSGHYGHPPRATWWLKQCLIYFIGLTGMKLFVLFLFAILPWLPWVGDWALRWAEDNEALQIAFAMFIFPLAMNAVQYWVIDNFIMEKVDRGGKKGEDDGGGTYERVLGGGDDDDLDDGDVDGGFVERVDEVRGKESADHTGAAAAAAATTVTLKSANPTPIPNYDERAQPGSSRGVSPEGEDLEEVDHVVDHEQDELRRR